MRKYCLRQDFYQGSAIIYMLQQLHQKLYKFQPNCHNSNRVLMPLKDRATRQKLLIINILEHIRLFSVNINTLTNFHPYHSQTPSKTPKKTTPFIFLFPSKYHFKQKHLLSVSLRISMGVKLHNFNTVMRSWQQMRQFSYVGIKLTKAKTISEGLTKCKIDKLTRQNPVYEHIKLHKLINGRKECRLCTTVKYNSKTKRTEDSQDLYQRGKTAPLLDYASSSKRTRTTKKESQRCLVQNSQQQQTSRELDRFQGVISHFGEALRRTKSQFHKMQDLSRRTARYFLTEASQLSQQINPSDAIVEVKSHRKELMQWQQAARKKQQQVDRQVRELNKPVMFPFSNEEMKAIVKQSKQRNFGANSKLNRMISSLYEYKAKANYANKMKIIKQYNQ